MNLPHDLRHLRAEDDLPAPVVVFDTLAMLAGIVILLWVLA